MTMLPEFPRVIHLVTQETIDRYADLSGDHNPLHVDPEFAGRTPFGSTIAHGPIALQPFWVAATRWLGSADLPAGSTVTATFRLATRPGDSITCEAVEVGSVNSQTHLDAECRNQNGETVVSIVAEFQLQ